MKQATLGSRSPAFQMQATDGTGSDQFSVSLDDYADRWLVLLFYPRDFSLI